MHLWISFCSKKKTTTESQEELNPEVAFPSKPINSFHIAQGRFRILNFWKLLEKSIAIEFKGMAVATNKSDDAK